MRKEIFLIVVLLLIPLASSLNVKQNTDHNLLIHCTLDGAPCTTSALCNLTSSYPNGSYIVENGIMTLSDNGDANYTKSFSILGEHPSKAFCTQNGVNDTTSFNIIVTTTGQNVSLSNIIIVLAFLIVGIILFLMGYTIEKEKWILKSSFYLFSLLMGLLAINSGSIIASESLELSRMSTAGLTLIISVILIMLLYVFITWTIQTFKQVKNKQEIRWNY